MTATKDEFFKPGKLTPQQKASATNDAVSQILAAETAQRLKKTERLREARLARMVGTSTSWNSPVFHSISGLVILA